MRYTLITPLEATRWVAGMSIPGFTPLRKSSRDGRPGTDGWDICGACGQSYAGHATASGGNTICPGDWVVTSGRGTEIVSHERFTSTYAPVRWVKRDFFGGDGEPVEAVQWNGPGDVEHVRPATPDDLPDGCGGFSCTAPHEVGRHGVTLDKGLMGSNVCPGDWFVTFPERAGVQWSDEHWSDRAFRDEFVEIVDTGAWEREGKEKS